MRRVCILLVLIACGYGIHLEDKAI